MLDVIFVQALEWRNLTLKHCFYADEIICELICIENDFA